MRLLSELSAHKDTFEGCGRSPVYGTSFNMLTQDSTNLTFSHLNSYPRETRNGKTQYDLFIAEYGDEGKRFLDTLGIG